MYITLKAQKLKRVQLSHKEILVCAAAYTIKKCLHTGFTVNKDPTILT